MDTFEIIELSVLALSAILIIPQIFLMRKQLKNNHEEHRRENTVNILHIWCNSLKKESSMSEDVVRKFNEQQCQSLYKHEPFGVSDEVIPSICKFCTLSKDDCPNCKITTSKRVEGKILNELRYHVISYLNMLETVMVSWHLGIVDQETIMMSHTEARWLSKTDIERFYFGAVAELFSYLLSPCCLCYGVH